MSLLLFVTLRLWSIFGDSGSVVSSVVSSNPALLSFHMLTGNLDRAHPCLWRHLRRTDATRADQVHGHVRGSAPARGDACHDHAATRRLWHGPGHRAGRPACGDAGRDVLPRMAGVAAATGRPRRSGDSRRRVARPRSVGWHTYALVVEANRAGSNR